VAFLEKKPIPFHGRVAAGHPGGRVAASGGPGVIASQQVEKARPGIRRLYQEIQEELNQSLPLEAM
jgi:acyl-CoA synthetase (NDP forming)